jgi:hypothetical protein
MSKLMVKVYVLFLFLLAPAFTAQGIRERIRANNRTAGAVSDTQAAAVTLTLNSVSMRPIQVWVRTAGRIEQSGKVLTGYVYPPDTGLVKIGQRVRTFSPESKSSMYQARVTKVTSQGERALVEVTLSGVGHGSSPNYVMEIVTERGEFLSIPNEAIIEEGTKQVVYVQRQPGQYLPQIIQTGIQGELYTEIQAGLKEGEQVVTFGSFFIDSEHKLKFANPDTDGAVTHE